MCHATMRLWGRFKQNRKMPSAWFLIVLGALEVMLMFFFAENLPVYHFDEPLQNCVHQLPKWKSRISTGMISHVLLRSCPQKADDPCGAAHL